MTVKIFCPLLATRKRNFTPRTFTSVSRGRQKFLLRTEGICNKSLHKYEAAIHVAFSSHWLRHNCDQVLPLIFTYIENRRGL